MNVEKVKLTGKVNNVNCQWVSSLEKSCTCRKKFDVVVKHSFFSTVKMQSSCHFIRYLIFFLEIIENFTNRFRLSVISGSTELAAISSVVWFADAVRAWVLLLAQGQEGIARFGKAIAKKLVLRSEEIIKITRNLSNFTAMVVTNQWDF